MNDRTTAILILNTAAEHFGVAVEAITSNSRKRELVLARHLTAYFVRQYTGMPLTAIGALLGDRDHSSIVHAITTIRKLLPTDRLVKRHYRPLREKVLERANIVTKNDAPFLLGICPIT
jgi:chromosomal replication initiator protein